MSNSLERQVADLRLHINALEKAAKDGSLPEALTNMRKTVKWSSLVIAAALVMSALIRLAQDGEIRALEKRIEHLEKALPSPRSM